MTTPETSSVEHEQIAPSLDGEAVECEEVQLLDADVVELTAYTFDSDDKTLVGLGSSESDDSSVVRNFDIGDRTLVGIGPIEGDEGDQDDDGGEHDNGDEREEIERDGRLDLLEVAVASDSLQIEAMPESAPMPLSEPPGPFVGADENEGALPRVPVHKAGPWMLTLLAAIGVGAVALAGGVLPHTTPPRVHAAAIAAPAPLPAELRFSYAPLESPASSSAQSPIARAPETPQPAAVASNTAHEKRAELRHALVKSGNAEPQLGTLDVISNPPASLVLDGRPFGKTPRVVQLPSGVHTVLFIHPERGRVSVTVSVKAGRTTNASADF
jgi:hypothetical protein